MLRELDKLQAQQRLAELTAENDRLMDGLTADNIEARIRRRSEIAIKMANLKKWLSESKRPTECPMDYGISLVVNMQNY